MYNISVVCNDQFGILAACVQGLLLSDSCLLVYNVLWALYTAHLMLDTLQDTADTTLCGQIQCRVQSAVYS